MPAALKIPAAIFDAMIEQARQELPNECCGFLAGTPAHAAPSITHRLPLRNESMSPVDYSADPISLFEAHRAMREFGVEVVAIYHSHPTAPAQPSRKDLQRNFWGDTPQVIISLESPAPVVRAFLLREHDFEEIGCVRVE